jgi:hypothetical protein
VKSFLLIFFIGLITGCCGNLKDRTHPSGLPIQYYNAQYAFRFFLPKSWDGYSASTQQLNCTRYSPEEDKEILVWYIPVITLQHPQRESDARYQDIPILIFTRLQWDAKVQPSCFAGGIIDELWHNEEFVFGLHSRYNADDGVRGWKEAADVVEQNRAANSMAPLRDNP